MPGTAGGHPAPWCWMGTAADEDTGMNTRYAQPLLAWYARHARDLPWRSPAATGWSVLVSEFMLQQTPVARVIPAHAQWLARWPTPAALASEPPAAAIRQWAARLSAPCAAAARNREDLDRTAWRGRAARSCGAARVAGSRQLHRRRGGQLRVRPAACGARHQCAPGARPAGQRPVRAGFVDIGGRDPAGRVAAAPRSLASRRAGR